GGPQRQIDPIDREAGDVEPSVAHVPIVARRDPVDPWGRRRGRSVASDAVTAEKLPYPKVPSRVDHPALERRIIEGWIADRTFEASIEQRPAENPYVFNDGPPFANGLPHYGHLLTGYVKDVVPRYQTMRGHRVERRFGWDCHGLPAEM